MSAPNFWTMDNFDLYVMGDEDICLAMLGDEDENGNKIESYTYADIDFAYTLFVDTKYEDYNIFSSIEDLNGSLNWYKVILKDGYYSGVQIYVDTQWYNIGKWSEEDCMDEFGMTKKETMLAILEEQKIISKWLEEVATDFGFRKLICDGVFSNGEAIYHYA